MSECVALIHHVYRYLYPHLTGMNDCHGIWTRISYILSFCLLWICETNSYHMSGTENHVEHFPSTTREMKIIICCFSSEECVSLPPSPMPILASLSSVDFWLQIKLELKTYFLFHMYGVSCLYCVRTNWKSNRQWIDFCTCMEEQRNWNKIFEAELLIGQILYNNLSIADWRYSVIFGHELYPIYTWFNFHHRIITSVSSDFARSDQYWLDSTSKHIYTCMYTNFLRRQ